jgi:DNA-binding transcriptional ArsR family regulator
MTATLTNAALSDDDRLSATFAALANSTRRAILAQLTTGATNVNELAEPFDMQLPAISKHLKVLERAGLVTRGRHAQYRPCALDAAPLAEVADWTEQYRPIWEARFDRLNDYLIQLRQQTAGTTESPTGSGISPPATPATPPT